MLRGRVVALGLASTAIAMCGSANAQAPESGNRRAAACRSAAGTGAATVATPTDPIGVALQQRLAAPPGKNDDPDRAALADLLRGRDYEPVWVDRPG